MVRLLRVRSSAWWGLGLCLSLMIGAHVFFDMLDIDGSDLQNRIFHDSLLPQTALAEAERSAHLVSLPLHAIRGMATALLPPRSSTRFNPQPKSVPIAARARLHGIILRVHVTRDCLPTPRTAEGTARPLLHII